MIELNNMETAHKPAFGGELTGRNNMFARTAAIRFDRLHQALPEDDDLEAPIIPQILELSEGERSASVLLPRSPRRQPSFGAILLSNHEMQDAIPPSLPIQSPVIAVEASLQNSHANQKLRNEHVDPDCHPELQDREPPNNN